MSVMSELDIMVRDGAKTAADFISRGVDPEKAKAMETMVEKAHLRELLHKAHGYLSILAAQGDSGARELAYAIAAEFNRRG